MATNTPPEPGSANPASNIAPGTVFCTGCGNPLVLSAAFCPGCGTPRATPTLVPSVPVAPAATVTYSGYAPVARPGVKSKTTAVVLAVFLSFWTWLYTYKTDAWKFWVGLAVWLLIALPLTFAYGVGFLFTLGINIWAIIDASVKSREYYTGYGTQKEPTSY